MLLKLPTFKYSDDPQVVTVSRPKSVRDQWVEFYETGGHICQVSDGYSSMPCLIAEKPVSISDGRVLSLKLQPLSITEVWSGITSQLSHIYVRCNGKTYEGEAMNGWRFKPINITPLRDYKKPVSLEAKAVVNQHFLAKEKPFKAETLFEQAVN